MINYIEHTDRNARVIVISPARKGLRAFLSSTAAAFGYYTPRDHAHDIEQMLWERLYGEKEYYIVVDEAQNLDLEAFRSALFLHDETGMPIAFVGNRSTLKRVNTKIAAFEQISDRLCHRVEIEGITRDDAVAFGVSHNVEGSEAYDYISQFALKTSLRQLDALLREARRRAGAQGSLKLDHLIDALGSLRGPDFAREFLPPKKNTRNVST